jgi:putative phosphoribosyl transferase
MYFRNRTEAGKVLLSKLKKIPLIKSNTIVLALPRGGVPVAYEIAKGLNLPLDIVLVNQIGVPSNPELAIGAVCEGGEVYFNQDLLKYLNLAPIDIEPFRFKAIEGLEKAISIFRNGRLPIDLYNKDVILVDDGVATGATMEVVLQLMHQKRVGKIIIAAPIASLEVVQKLILKSDKVVYVITPQFLNSVGQWYENFEQVENDKVIKILEQYKLKADNQSHKLA